MLKFLETLTKNVTLRKFFLKVFKIFSFFNRIYHQQVLHKPQSKEIFADAEIPTSKIRVSILQGLGIPEKELRKKPLIAVCNSFSEINPGHKHLKEIAEVVKDGIYAGGGVPFEFGVPAPCDGIANGNEGMKYILPQRDLIADIVETYINSQWFDGVVFISSCDKINPGMLMAAARLNLPAIFITGGPNLMKIRFKPESKSIDHQNYEKLADKILTATAATCGACEIMGPANTFQILIEALGMALPFSAVCPAFVAEKNSLAFQTGVRIVQMVKENLTARKILTKESLQNAVMVALAVGGSTNTSLHLPALAHNLGINFEIKIFNEFNKKIPTLCGISPNGPYGIYDLFLAGGVPAVLKRLKNNLHLNCLNVEGKTLAEIINKANIINEEVIRSRENPYHPEGGIVALFGNLAPEGCIVKQSAISEEMKKFTGSAICFNSEKETLEALMGGKIKNGQVIVTRYEGPKGSPGMPEMLSITTLINILGLKNVALITDGRFSGASSGPCVGHISPEAALGGNIALIQDGDKITIDIPERKIELLVSEEELASRKKTWKPPGKEIKSNYLKRYREKVSQASKGAVLI